MGPLFSQEFMQIAKVFCRAPRLLCHVKSTGRGFSGNYNIYYRSGLFVTKYLDLSGEFAGRYRLGDFPKEAILTARKCVKLFVFLKCSGGNLSPARL